MYSLLKFIKKRQFDKSKGNSHLSPGQIAWKRFKRHRLAMVSLWILLGLGILSIVIPVITNQPVDQANINEIFKEPSAKHLLGTDENGYDVFVRLFYGGRISLSVGLIAAFSAAFIGTMIGSMAGYFGGVIDAVLMRITDTMLSLPVLPLLIILSQVEFKKIAVGEWSLAFIDEEEWGKIFKIIVIIALFSWMSVARLVRGEVLSLKHREFIDAARVLGASHRQIIWKHLVPNSLTPVIISTTLSLGSVIQYEAVLGFLGLGIPSSIPTWGNMLSNSLGYFVNAPFLFIYPGVLIAVTVVCINFIGDGLRDALDPRQILEGKR